MGFEQCEIMCTHHCMIIQDCFTALKVLCASPVHSSLSPYPWQPLIVRVFSWNYAVCSLLRLAFSLSDTQ